MRARALFAATVVVHLVALYMPHAPSQASAWNVDKLGHMVLFGMVLWAGVRAGVPVRLLAGLLAAHAVVSEVIRGLELSGRSGDWRDAVADMAGIAVVLWWLHRRSQRAPADLSAPGRPSTPGLT